MTTRQFVLAAVDRLGIWNFYPTMDAARADMDRANASDPGCKYAPMEYEAYKAAERATMLGDAPQQITAGKWEEMLCVLPPLKWESGAGFESFLMSEFWSGPYTQQYVRRGVPGSGDKITCWCKMVDATERNTWMDAAF